MPSPPLGARPTQNSSNCCIMPPHAPLTCDARMDTRGGRPPGRSSAAPLMLRHLGAHNQRAQSKMRAEEVPGRTAASAAPAHARLEAAKPGSPKGVAGLAGPPRGGISSKVCTPALPQPLRARLNCPRDTRAELVRVFCPGQAYALFPRAPAQATHCPGPAKGGAELKAATAPMAGRSKKART